MSTHTNLTTHSRLSEAVLHALLMQVVVPWTFPANVDGALLDFEQRTVTFVGPQYNDFLRQASVVAANAATNWFAGNTLPTRCPSCDHDVTMHQPDGCWYAVTEGTPGQALNCPCARSYQRG